MRAERTREADEIAARELNTCEPHRPSRTGPRRRAAGAGPDYSAPAGSASQAARALIRATGTDRPGPGGPGGGQRSRNHAWTSCNTHRAVRSPSETDVNIKGMRTQERSQRQQVRAVGLPPRELGTEIDERRGLCTRTEIGGNPHPRVHAAPWFSALARGGRQESGAHAPLFGGHAPQCPSGQGLARDQAEYATRDKNSRRRRPRPCPSSTSSTRPARSPPESPSSPRAASSNGSRQRWPSGSGQGRTTS